MPGTPIYILIFVAFLGWPFAVSGLDHDEKSAIEAIKNDEVDGLKAYLEKHPGLNCEFSNGKTGLYYAIEYDRDRICEFLLKRGADPDFTVGDHTLLNWAVRYDRRRIARFLIEYGADVNLPDKNSDSPLIYAAKFNSLELCSILTNRGANPLYINLQGRKASDYAGNYYDSPAFRYLLSMEELFEERDSISSMRDGPYIFHEGDDRVVMTYFEHDPAKGPTRMIEKTLESGASDMVVDGFGWDSNAYHILQEYAPDPTEITTTGDIFVLGDIHGKYQAMLKILINNRIIDSNRMWTFGRGHLILLGDDFDRGEYVTETLWFLHELEIRARKAGGKVHLLLGNHEIMELTGDDRYLHDKYRYFTQYTGIGYSSLYDKNTVLGRWLRSKNIIVQINGNLFLHAGISPQFALYNYSFPEINQMVRNYLNSDYSIIKGSPEEVILGGFGPLWYRGYDGPDEDFPEVTQGFLDAFLGSKGLRRMIVGHNEQTNITASFGGKIITADVAIDETGQSAQGLLISGDRIFRCFSNGVREPVLSDE